MCSYDTTQTVLSGSAKRESGWTGISSASIYCACPFHSVLDESINIDLFIKNKPEERVALELSVESARAFAYAILETIQNARMHTTTENLETLFSLRCIQQ